MPRAEAVHLRRRFNDKSVAPLSQLGGPVLSVGGHHSAQLVAGQRCSGCEGPFPGCQQGGRAAEEADRESDVSYRTPTL